MNRLLILLCFCLASLGGTLSAQEVKKDTIVVITQNESGNEVEILSGDTTIIALGKKKMIIINEGKNRGVRIITEGGEQQGRSEDDDDEDDEDDDDEDDDDEDDDEDDDDWKSDRKRNYDPTKVDALAFDLGVNNFFQQNTWGAPIPQLALRNFRPGGHVAIHLLPTRVSLIGRGTVNLKTALTFDFNNHYFTTPGITLLPERPSLSFDTQQVSLSRNKLTANYFQIPLLLNFNSHPRSGKGVSFSVGGYAGILMNSHTKQRGEELRRKVNDDFNLNAFRYGLMARLDLAWFDIYAMYNLSNLFANNQGPQAQTFMAGVNLIDF